MSFSIKSTKSISMLLVLSVFFSVFVPISAEAGVLGKILSAVRPVAGIVGNIGGAFAGASMCAGMMPPLGMLVGAVGGYLVGGSIARYASGSLGNLAALGGAALGVMAGASLGPVGYVVGAIAGGILGRMAMGYLYNLDNRLTGGHVLSPAVNSRGESVMVNSPVYSAESSVPSTQGEAVEAVIPPSYQAVKTPGLTAEEQRIDAELNASADDLAAVSAAYERAYANYISVVRSGSAEEIKAASEEYRSAYAKYKALTGEEPR